jgi:DNA polymerase
MADRPEGRSVVRDFEAYLVALRETFGDDVVADPAGTLPAPVEDLRLPEPATAASTARPLARSPARPLAEARGSGAAGPLAEARGSGRVGPLVPSPATPPSRRTPPAGVTPSCPQPVQTSFLAEASPAPPPSPGLRRSRAAEPGAIDFHPFADIVRGPCSPDVRAAALEAVDVQVRVCTKCALHKGRTTTVFGVGHPCARVCFVGEGPGAEEDKRGEPFVGRAGQLLDRIVSAMKLRRADVYICNTVKCRPPENRTPYPEEMEACNPYLRTQLETIAPQVIVALGRPAAQMLLGVNSSLGDLRGRFHRHRGIPVMVTYHPAYLLRNPDAKKFTWEDVQHVMRFLAETPDPLLLPADGGRC